MLVAGGDLTAGAAPVLSARLAGLIDRQGRRRITVDLHGVRCVDATAIDVLVHAGAWVGTLGGALTLDRVAPSVMAAIGDHPGAGTHLTVLEEA